MITDSDSAGGYIIHDQKVVVLGRSRSSASIGARFGRPRHVKCCLRSRIDRSVRVRPARYKVLAGTPFDLYSCPSFYLPVKLSSHTSGFTMVELYRDLASGPTHQCSPGGTVLHQCLDFRPMHLFLVARGHRFEQIQGRVHRLPFMPR